MVDRYKKSGGFVQLLQIVETCAPKKYDQFMGIISEEDPSWAEAIKEKMLTFDKIMNWKPEAVMEVLAQVNPLAFATAIKGQTPEKLEKFFSSISHQEKRRIEQQLNDIKPSPAEIYSCMMKVISETRLMLVSGSLKAAKIDAQLVIPDGFEEKLSAKAKSGTLLSTELFSDEDTIAVSGTTATSAVPSFAAGTGGALELDKLQKKITILNREAQTLKQENAILKDKLEKIKKIA